MGNGLHGGGAGNFDKGSDGTIGWFGRTGCESIEKGGVFILSMFGGLESAKKNKIKNNEQTTGGQGMRV